MGPSSHQGSPTLRDIARAIGVSHVTVSLALRNNSQIPETRRVEIQDVARRMGYQPNAAASMLALHKRMRAEPQINAALAWLNRWPEPKNLRGYAEFDGYWCGAYTAAEKFGYRLEEFTCNDDLPLERLEKILIARGIRGILLPPHAADLQWSGLRWDHFSAVRFGRSIRAPRLHIVTSDQVANTMLAFQKIRRHGYKRVGFVTGRAEERGALYKAGFMMAQEGIEPALRLPVLTLEETNPAANRQRLSRWLRDTRAQAILSDVASVRAMLERIGCRIPADAGLAALSILDGGAEAGIDQNPEEIGRAAVLLVLSLINDNAQGVPATLRQILIEGSWVNGPTLPVRKGIKAASDGLEFDPAQSEASMHSSIRLSFPRREYAKAARRKANPANPLEPSDPPEI